jgi:hypothetical protein
MHHREDDEVVQEIQKVSVFTNNFESFKIGDVVKWIYESKEDQHYGALYMIVGLNSEKSEIIVARILDRPYLVREFHVSQLRHA